MSQFKNQQQTSSSGAPHFQGYQLKNEAPQDQAGGNRSVEQEQGTSYDVRSFELTDLRKLKTQGYNEVKAKYGPLAVTDPEHQARSAKDARFRLNSLQREPLAVDQ